MLYVARVACLSGITMQTSKLRVLQGAAIFVVAGMSALATWLSASYPFLVPIAAAVAGAAGKWLGVPLQAVTQDAISKMPAAQQVNIAVKAVQSLPPNTANRLIDEIVKASYRPPAISIVSAGASPPSLVNTEDQHGKTEE